MIDARPDLHLDRALSSIRGFAERAKNIGEVGTADLWIEAEGAVQLARELAARALGTAAAIELSVLETLRTHDETATPEENIVRLIHERTIARKPRAVAIAMNIEEFWGVIRRLSARVEPTIFDGYDVGFVEMATAYGPMRIVGGIECPRLWFQVLG